MANGTTLNEVKSEVTTLSTGLLKKLADIQHELKAPKNQYNSFGKYNYRSCEDILEGVKPLLKKHDTTLTIKDELVCVGNRYYVKAIATLFDCLTGETIENTAYAREEESKKGMDGSQVTGACSSYARKYALNGLLLIDDTKDADTDQFKKATESKPKTREQPKKTSDKPTQQTMDRVNFLRGECQQLGLNLEEDWAIKLFKKNCNGKHEMFDMNEQELLKYCEVLEIFIDKKKKSDV